MNGLPAPSRRQLAACVLGLLVLSAALSWGSARTESLTLDEPVHLTAGMSYLATGDFRLNPEHPPLAKVWAALPLVFVPHAAFDPGCDGFADGDAVEVARDWLGKRNDGASLGQVPRAAMLLLTAAFLAAVTFTIHRLFGPGPAILGLAVAALDPAILSHGHYITTDVPVSLFLLLSLLAFDAFLARPTVARFAAFAIALAASALTKYSWVLILPALAAMAVMAGRRGRGAGGSRPSLVAAGALAAALLLTGAAVWGAYGLRFSSFRPDLATPSTRPAPIIRTGLAPGQVEDAWREVSRDWRGVPRTGLVTVILRTMRDYRLLPDAYLYGIAFARHWADARRTFLMGRFSSVGFRAYFPVALAVKTPLASLVLALAGLAVLLWKRAPPVRRPILAVGVFAFGGFYFLAAVMGNLNIGIRHLLPASPALFALAGAAAGWATYRSGRIVLWVLVVLLLATTVRAYPLYLGYFNELAGGWQNGHRWLVDSNLDWDQDLLRLRDYQRAHPDERLVLLRYGSEPMPTGLVVEPFFKEGETTTFVPLTPGTYVFSATELVGTFQPLSQPETWTRSDVRERYRSLWLRFSAMSEPAPDAGSFERDRRVFDGMRHGLLIVRLGSRTPDLRLGTGLFVYRLGETEIADLTRPE
ncbi:MAG: hypothetical protein ACHQPI_12655 [Thermoanaerobaculia bacterium]